MPPDTPNDPPNGTPNDPPPDNHPQDEDKDATPMSELLISPQDIEAALQRHIRTSTLTSGPSTSGVSPKSETASRG